MPTDSNSGGTPCSLQYSESGERERVWVVDPGHPVADGLDESLVVPETEMYGGPFAVPDPEVLGLLCIQKNC